MSLPSHYFAGPSPRLYDIDEGLPSPAGDRNTVDTAVHPESATSGITHNNYNYGRGVFNDVRGDQHVQGDQYTLNFTLTGNTSDKGEHKNTSLSHVLEQEPYQTIVDMLSRIRLHALFMAKRFDPDVTITGMCDELNELIPLVRWTARSIKQIVKNFPLMSRSSFISRAQQSAFEWTTRLKGLVSDVEEFKPYQEPSQWSSLYQHLRTWVRGPRAEMTQFLCIITASHFYRSFDIENARLGEFVTKLSLTRGLRNPRVDTIWVREPTGMEWFCIPLKFCETWEGFSTVIYEYCKNGPEIEYIRGGNWAIIRDTDNHIIDQMQFTSVLKPEMRFDIGVIVRLASLSAGTCPQCGHQSDGSNSVDGWVRCSNIECANLFRIVFQPNDKSTEPVASKSTHSRMLSSNKKRAKTLSRGRISSRTRIQHLSTKFHRMLANIPYPPLEKMQDDSLSSENDNGTSKTHEPLVNVEIPQWLSMAMQVMQAKYLNDNMEAVFRNIKGSTTPEWRIKCTDCPGKFYSLGPGETLSSYEIHLKNRLHRRRVEERMNGGSVS